MEKEKLNQLAKEFCKEKDVKEVLQISNTTIRMLDWAVMFAQYLIDNGKVVDVDN